MLIGTFASFTCLVAGCSFAFGYFARFRVFIFNATAREAVALVVLVFIFLFLEQQTGSGLEISAAFIFLAPQEVEANAIDYASNRSSKDKAR